MHTELATVPDFTLQRLSRQPGDCERYLANKLNNSVLTHRRYNSSPLFRSCLMSNPYQSLTTQTELPIATPSNSIARIGFFASLTGVVSLFAIGPFGSLISTVSSCVAFVSLPGLIISCLGLFYRPRRLAGWGVAMGIFGCLYLPTIFLSLFHFR